MANRGKAGKNTPAKKPSAKPARSAKTATKKKPAQKAPAKPAAKKTPPKKAAPAKAAKAAKAAKPAKPAKAPAKAPPPKKAPPPEAKKASKPAAPSKPPPKAAEASAADDQRHSEIPPALTAAQPVPDGWGAHPDAGLTGRQLHYLYNRLVEERKRKIDELQRHMEEALGDAGVMPDETDMAQRHTEQAYLIRFADKERKLLNEIEGALEKLRLNEYGVCEGTEEPIGFKRLELRPWTRYSVAYKEQIERERSQHRR